MDQGAQRQPLERIRRLAGDGLPKRPSLSQQPPLTAEQALGWADYAETSPLYQHLTKVVSGDDRLLSVLNSIDHLPRHNILFAGVQYLMLRDGPGELGQFYPNFTERTRPIGDIDGPFTDLVLENAPELVVLGRTRYTQTNECRRCVALLPGVWLTGLARFHLVDFGTSAGLNLHIDRYQYRWGDTRWGPDSPVRLVTNLRSGEVEPRDIEIISRTGLDLNPIDPSDPDDRRWLESLIWPEHHERRSRLRAALEVAAANPPSLIAGDALETLQITLRDLPSAEPVVVINSFILNQFDEQRRQGYAEALQDGRKDRPVYQLSMEWLDREAEGADLSIDDGDGLRKVGRAQPHGEWLELYARP